MFKVNEKIYFLAEVTLPSYSSNSRKFHAYWARHKARHNLPPTSGCLHSRLPKPCSLRSLGFDEAVRTPLVVTVYLSLIRRAGGQTGDKFVRDVVEPISNAENNSAWEKFWLHGTKSSSDHWEASIQFLEIVAIWRLQRGHVWMAIRWQHQQLPGLTCVKYHNKQLR